MLSLIELLQQLIACPSVTPKDAGCQILISQHLQRLGFEIEHLPFGDVNNFWARRGKNEPLFVFAGHTDVVPTGPVEKWDMPPFEGKINNGLLYGRGSADMKGSLAAMLIACEKFITHNPNHYGSMAWLITSDEEGPSINGSAKVVETLKNRNVKIDYCLVGEPTCEEKLGDTLKIGRRGSLSGHLIIQGKQGHIAYPKLAKNPIHLFSPVLAELLQTQWDNTTNPEFQATSFQISNINAGTGAGNVIPDILDIKFNFRYSPVTTSEKLQKMVEEILKKNNLDYRLNWLPGGGKPFLSYAGRLRNNAISSIKEITGIFPNTSTTGGVSDARFIAPLGTEVIEFGPCNRTIHQINEYVSITDLEQLVLIYETLLKKMLLNLK